MTKRGHEDMKLDMREAAIVKLRILFTLGIGSMA
jgi:hypothetical protein